MTGPERPRYLAVGRLRKPHGLKGEFAIFPLTAEPDLVFAPGEAGQRAMDCMMRQVKLDIGEIRAAYEGATTPA